MDGQAVAGLVGDRLHLDEIALREPRRDLRQLGQLLGRRLIEVACAQGAVAPCGDHENIFVLVAALQIDLVAGELLFQIALEGFHLGVEELAFALPGDELHFRVDLALARPGKPRHVDLGMLEDDALLLGGRGVDAHDRRLVAIDVGGGEQQLVVEVEEQRLDLFLEVGGDHRLERGVFVRPVQNAGIHSVSDECERGYIRCDR